MVVPRYGPDSSDAFPEKLSVLCQNCLPMFIYVISTQTISDSVETLDIAAFVRAKQSFLCLCRNGAI